MKLWTHCMHLEWTISGQSLISSGFIILLLLHIKKNQNIHFNIGIHSHLKMQDEETYMTLNIQLKKRSSIQTFQFKCQGMEFSFFFFNCCGLIWVRIYYELIFIWPFLDHCLVMVKGFEKLHKSMSHAVDMNLSKFWEMVWDSQAWKTAPHGVEMSWTCFGDWTIIFILILMWIVVSIIVFFFFSVLGLFHFCGISHSLSLHLSFLSFSLSIWD